MLLRLGLYQTFPSAMELSNCSYHAFIIPQNKIKRPTPIVGSFDEYGINLDIRHYTKYQWLFINFPGSSNKNIAIMVNWTCSVCGVIGNLR